MSNDITASLGVEVSATARSEGICAIAGLSSELCIVGATSIPPGTGQIICGREQAVLRVCGPGEITVPLGIEIVASAIVTAPETFDHCQTYITKAVLNDNSDTYLFEDIDIGDEYPNRMIVIGLATSALTTVRHYVSAEIDGNQMTLAHEEFGASGQGCTAIYCLPWPTGATADFNITLDGTTFSCTLVVYSISPADAAPIDTGGAHGGGATTISDLEIVDGGSAIFMSISDSTGSALTWNGIDTPGQDVADFANDSGDHVNAWSIDTSEDSTVRDASFNNASFTVTSAATWACGDPDSGGGGGDTVDPIAAVTYSGTRDLPGNKTFRFNAAALGDPDPDRVIVIGVGVSVVGSARNASVSLDGSGMTKVQEELGPLGRGSTALFRVAKPLGSTGDIIVTTSNTAQSVSIVVWSMITSTPAQLETGGASGGGVHIISDLDVEFGGIVLAVALSASGSLSMTWTGIDGASHDVDGLNAGSGNFLDAFSVATSETATDGDAYFTNAVTTVLSIASWAP